jgi:argininosuccinate synthase
MKREDSTLLNKYGKDPGFKVPENYFADFNQRMADMLPDVEITPIDVKPTMWQRLKPLAYMAAMFAGVWCMMSVFSHFTNTSNLSGVSIVAEKLQDDKSNVDEFIMSGSVSDYDILSYEDTVAMSNEEDFSTEE